MPCTHAELIMEYAKDCQEYERPWERWELRCAGSIKWVDLESHPKWKPNTRYRRKPRTITIPQSELPEPMREEPVAGTPIYKLNPHTVSGIDCTRWQGGAYDLSLLRAGLIYHTEEDARGWLDWWREHVMGRGE